LRRHHHQNIFCIRINNENALSRDAGARGTSVIIAGKHRLAPARSRLAFAYLLPSTAHCASTRFVRALRIAHLPSSFVRFRFALCWRGGVQPSAGGRQ
jgi:hypothetical protein